MAIMTLKKVFHFKNGICTSQDKRPSSPSQIVIITTTPYIIILTTSIITINVIVIIKVRSMVSVSNGLEGGLVNKLVNLVNLVKLVNKWPLFITLPHNHHHRHRTIFFNYFLRAKKEKIICEIYQSRYN